MERAMKDTLDKPEAIPLTKIDPHALRRDRRAINLGAFEELKCSIRDSGLRCPIEVFPHAHPTRETVEYGLLSGYRRLSAFLSLYEQWELDRFAAIPAFIRDPQTDHDRFAAMIEENAVRDDVTPWDQGAAAVYAAASGF